MKRILLTILIVCIAVAFAFAYVHHLRIERRRVQFDTSFAANAPVEGTPAASESAPANSSLDLVHQLPAGASAVVFTDVAALRASTFANELSSLAPTPAQDPAYTEFVRATGFDYSRDLDRAAVALWPQTSTTSIMALAQGRFDQAKIENYALHNGGRRIKIRGTDVYEVREDVREENPPRLVRFSFLNPREIVLADGPAISEVLGPGVSRIDSQMSARVARVSGDPIYAVARTQDLPKDLGIDVTKSTQLARLLRSVHAITAAGKPAGENLNVSASAECNSSVNALELSTTLQGLLWMGRVALSDSKTQQQIGPQWPALDALLRAADISHENRLVRLRLQITPEILRAAAAFSSTADPRR